MNVPLFSPPINLARFDDSLLPPFVDEKKLIEFGLNPSVRTTASLPQLPPLPSSSTVTVAGQCLYAPPPPLLALPLETPSLSSISSTVSAVFAETSKRGDFGDSLLPPFDEAYGACYTEESCEKKILRKIRPWSTNEDNLVVELVKELGTKWTQVADKFNRANPTQQRLANRIRERYVNFLNPKRILTAWSPKEDQKLITLHAKYGRYWTKIAKKMEGRTSMDCANRWRTEQTQKLYAKVTSASLHTREKEVSNQPNTAACEASDSEESPKEDLLRKVRYWSTSEDALLVNLVKEMGENWSQIGEEFNKANPTQRRKVKSIKARYCNILNPKRVLTAWSLEEDQKLITLHAKYGSYWTKIAKKMEGRTRMDCANHWATVPMKKLYAEVKSVPGTDFRT